MPIPLIETVKLVRMPARPPLDKNLYERFVQIDRIFRDFTTLPFLHNGYETVK